MAVEQRHALDKNLAALLQIACDRRRLRDLKVNKDLSACDCQQRRHHERRENFRERHDRRQS